MRATRAAAAMLAAPAGVLLAAGCLPDGPPDSSGGGPGADPAAHAGAMPGGAGYADVFTGAAGAWIDLSHSFGPSTIYWPTDTAGFQLRELAYGRTDAGHFYAAYSFASAEHGGTHLDAPIHFAEGGLAADEVPLSSLIAAASVVDVSARAGADPDYMLAVEDLVAWEAEHGRIADGSALLVRTGWSSRWSDRAAYLGTALTGPEAVPELHFPGIGPDAARWLVDNRAVAAVGIDTPSIDRGQSRDYRAHVILYEAGIPGFENLAGLERLPATGAGIVALPMKIEGGSGAPLRVAAWVPPG